MSVTVREQLGSAWRTMSQWAEMIKFAHSVFALPFAIIATFLAARSAFLASRSSHPYPGLLDFLLIIGCMVTARSVAMTFNRIVDAELDARNPRTSQRALPVGVVSRRQAVVFLLAAMLGFLLFCAGFWLVDGNVFPMALALPVLGYLCLYSYAKRFTKWSHFVLGSAIAVSPLAAWLAIDPLSVGWPTLILSGVVTLWIGGFDVIYACQDIAFDREARLHSLPSRLGPAAALWIARVAHLGTVLLLLALLPVAGLGYFYAAGVALAALLLLVENSLVHPNDFSRVNLAFFNINGAISLLLAVLAITDILLLAPAA